MPRADNNKDRRKPMIYIHPRRVETIEEDSESGEFVVTAVTHGVITIQQNTTTEETNARGSDQRPENSYRNNRNNVRRSVLAGDNVPSGLANSCTMSGSAGDNVLSGPANSSTLSGSTGDNVRSRPGDDNVNHTSANGSIPAAHASDNMQPRQNNSLPFGPVNNNAQRGAGSNVPDTVSFSINMQPGAAGDELIVDINHQTSMSMFDNIHDMLRRFAPDNTQSASVSDNAMCMHGNNTLSRSTMRSQPIYNSAWTRSANNNNNDYTPPRTCGTLTYDPNNMFRNAGISNNTLPNYVRSFDYQTTDSSYDTGSTQVYDSVQQPVTNYNYGSTRVYSSVQPVPDGSYGSTRVYSSVQPVANDNYGSTRVYSSVQPVANSNYESTRVYSSVQPVANNNYESTRVYNSVQPVADDNLPTPGSNNAPSTAVSNSEPFLPTRRPFGPFSMRRTDGSNVTSTSVRVNTPFPSPPPLELLSRPRPSSTRYTNQGLGSQTTGSLSHQGSSPTLNTKVFGDMTAVLSWPARQSRGVTSLSGLMVLGSRRRSPVRSCRYSHHHQTKGLETRPSTDSSSRQTSSTVTSNSLDTPSTESLPQPGPSSTQNTRDANVDTMDEVVNSLIDNFEREKGALTAKLAAIADHVEKTLTCYICLDVPTNASVLNCGHTFCQNCIRVWGQTNYNNYQASCCPNCRVPIRTCAPCPAINSLLAGLYDELPSIRIKRRRL